jgi:hypothetical protein
MSEERPIIRINLQEIQYNNIFFPIRIVKKYIIKLYESRLKPYTIYKTFNKVTGNIDRKYAWDTIFHDFNSSNQLRDVLNRILNDESEGAFS